MPGNPRTALLVAVETLWTPLMHERSALDCLKTMQGTSQATLHGKLVGEQVKLVIVDWKVFHLALLITEHTGCPSLAWPRMVKKLGLQPTLAGCLAFWEGAGHFCEVLALLVELLVELGARRKCFASLSELLSTLSGHAVVLRGGHRQGSRSTYARNLQ
jgi:hypothetical protein